MKINAVHGLFRRAFSGKKAKALTTGIYRFNRRITHPQYQKAARYCASEMRKAGLDDVEVLRFPIDGKRFYGNWKTPYFWDVRNAWLDIKIAGRWTRFADYRKIPTSVFVYAAPTRGVVETELVPLERGVRQGSLVFCDVTDDGKLRQAALESEARGGLGLVTDFSPNWEGVRGNADFRDGHRWDNGTLFEAKKPLAGFSLSRNQGDVLRRALREHGRLPCRYRIDGYRGRGDFLCVTGCIRGKGLPDEEVLSVAHLYEAGANDNASGCAVSMEALNAVLRLVRQGRLKPPERTIRVVFAFEIVGFLAYFENRKRLNTRYVAGVNPDMAGEDQGKCKSTLNVYQAPDACASFVNPLTLHLVKKAAGASLKYAVKKFIVNDNSITDPGLGPPCTALIHLRDRFYHSNEDTPDKVSASTLGKVGAVIAAFLYLCATPDEGTARETAELCLTYAGDRLGAEPLSPEKRAYILECESRRLRDLARAARADLGAFEDRLASLAGSAPVKGALSPAKPPPALAKKAASLVPARRVMGPLTFEHIPFEKRRKMKFQPHWSGKWNLPLFWADGKRDLYDIYRRASFESGPYALRDFLEYFIFLEKEGFVRLVKKKALKVSC